MHLKSNVTVAKVSIYPRHTETGHWSDWSHSLFQSRTLQQHFHTGFMYAYLHLVEIEVHNKGTYKTHNTTQHIHIHGSSEYSLYSSVHPVYLPKSQACFVIHAHKGDGMNMQRKS